MGHGSRIYLEHCRRYEFAKQFVSGFRCLDLACGCGYGSITLAGAGAVSVIGMDIAEEAIAYAHEHYDDKRVRFALGDGARIPVPTGSVEVVISFETIEHIREYKAFLQEIRRVLTDGGRFIVSTPNGERYVRYPGPPANPFHIKEFTKREMSTQLSKAGFMIEAVHGQTLMKGNQYKKRMIRWLLSMDKLHLLDRIRACVKNSSRGNEAVDQEPEWSRPPKFPSDVEVRSDFTGSSVYNYLIFVARKTPVELP